MKEVTYTRRTVKVKSSFYVSLPSFWAKANGIDRYGEVEITAMKDGSLRIAPEGSHE